MNFTSATFSFLQSSLGVLCDSVVRTFGFQSPRIYLCCGEMAGEIKFLARCGIGNNTYNKREFLEIPLTSEPLNHHESPAELAARLCHPLHFHT